MAKPYTLYPTSMVAHIFKDKHLRLVFGASAAILLLTAIIGFVKFGMSSEKIIVHFDVFKGIDFLGEKSDVRAIIIYGILMAVLNFFLADFLYERERFLSYIFAFVTLFLSGLVLTAISIIISKN